MQQFQIFTGTQDDNETIIYVLPEFEVMTSPPSIICINQTKIPTLSPKQNLRVLNSLIFPIQSAIWYIKLYLKLSLQTQLPFAYWSQTIPVLCNNLLLQN